MSCPNWYLLPKLMYFADQSGTMGGHMKIYLLLFIIYCYFQIQN